MHSYTYARISVHAKLSSDAKCSVHAKLIIFVINTIFVKACAVHEKQVISLSKNL